MSNIIRSMPSSYSMTAEIMRDKPPKYVVGGLVPRMTDPKVRRRIRLMPRPRPLDVPSLDPISATWVWANQANGDITWTFTNNTANQLSFILLRNGYYFGNAFFPVYANGSFGAHFASSLSPLSGASLPPLGVVGFAQPDGSSKYIAAFIFTLAGNASWTMPEGGFKGFSPSGISAHVVTLRLNRDTCIFYDQAQVTQTTIKPMATHPDTPPIPASSTLW
jgi:hypothetical protein